ncbi:MAG TPA: hypothetical protein VEC17_02310 [Candidatus Binatia bacterium]|nr:hypothetical protein [Candidatus Binatia bacterium]
MSEYGFERDPSHQEIEEGLETRLEDKEDDPDLTSLISQFEEQCEHVYVENEDSLNELFADAKEYMDVKNKAEWIKLLKDTKGALMDTDDSMEIDDILRQAKSEAVAKGLMESE